MIRSVWFLKYILSGMFLHCIEVKNIKNGSAFKDRKQDVHQDFVGPWTTDSIGSTIRNILAIMLSLGMNCQKKKKKD